MGESSDLKGISGKLYRKIIFKNGEKGDVVWNPINCLIRSKSFMGMEGFQALESPFAVNLTTCWV